jgi:hypothetical protein
VVLSTRRRVTVLLVAMVVVVALVAAAVCLLLVLAGARTAEAAGRHMLGAGHAIENRDASLELLKN